MRRLAVLGGVAQSWQLVPSPSVDGYMTAMGAHVVDVDVNSVPISQVMLHRIVFAKIERVCTCGR